MSKYTFELWRDIEGFPDYQASSFGRIKRKAGVRKSCYGSEAKVKEKILKLQLKAEYYYIRLYSKYDKRVSRLVAAAFYGPSTLEVNHKDGNKLNNFIHNLEYVTRSNNIKHAYRSGLFKSPVAKIGEQEVRTIRQQLIMGKKQIDIAKDLNVSPWIVSRIKCNKAYNLIY